jgi:hypothetical protein
MTFYIMMHLVCSSIDCNYEPYHGMTYDTKQECETARQFLEKVHGASPPNLKCDGNGRKI